MQAESFTANAASVESFFYTFDTIQKHSGLLRDFVSPLQALTFVSCRNFCFLINLYPASHRPMHVYGRPTQRHDTQSFRLVTPRRHDESSRSIGVMGKLMNRMLIMRYYHKLSVFRYMAAVRGLKEEVKSVEHNISSMMTSGRGHVEEALLLESSRGVCDGVYKVVGCDRWEGMPLWECAGMVMYSNMGRWNVVKKEHIGSEKLSVWLSEEKHGERMPWQVGRWLGYMKGAWIVDKGTRVNVCDAAIVCHKRKLKSKFSSDVQVLFFSLDRDKDGLASYEECKTGLAALGRPFTTADLIAAFSAVDSKATRLINLKDFTRLVYILFPDISRVGEVYNGIKSRRL
eukprot:TRINITY_DN5195_c0_g1_i3.p1 TRINITY_DN5195_c0_g1~~TRINITY_DN5195_c0_g1_i3.p1  ORF type:complete len:344 (+),score=45.05 TRINITY_DN5195_c0_g1_i3:973-2004(+)